VPSGSLFPITILFCPPVLHSSLLIFYPPCLCSFICTGPVRALFPISFSIDLGELGPSLPKVGFGSHRWFGPHPDSAPCTAASACHLQRVGLCVVPSVLALEVSEFGGRPPDRPEAQRVWVLVLCSCMSLPWPAKEGFSFIRSVLAQSGLACSCAWQVLCLPFTVLKMETEFLP
jgi:hypothetical protein